MKYSTKAIQLSDSIKIKAIRDSFSDVKTYGDADELFIMLSGNNFVYIFKYGVVCFFNISNEKQQRFIKRIKPFSSSLAKIDINEFQDIEIGKKLDVTPDCITIEELDIETIKLIMFNISQSVALDYYCSLTEKLLEDTRMHTDKLEQSGKLSLSGNKLKKFIGSVLNIRNSIVENLYIFDTPDAIWENEQLNQLDKDLKKHFDLKDRYRSVHEQVDIIKENLELFKDFMFHNESSRLEWIIIILILVEVFDLFLTKI